MGIVISANAVIISEYLQKLFQLYLKFLERMTIYFSYTLNKNGDLFFACHVIIV
jgi:hypothetical protein